MALENGVGDEAELVAAVVSAGAARGIDVGRPFPFLVSGRADLVRFHVLDKRDELPHTPERHERAKMRGTIERERVEVVGFYSEHHRGIFTPKDANVHMHVKTTDGRVSGHLETVRWLTDATIWVPGSSPGDPHPVTLRRETP